MDVWALLKHRKMSWQDGVSTVFLLAEDRCSCSNFAPDVFAF